MARDLQFPIVGHVNLRGFIRDIQTGRPVNASMMNHPAFEPVITNEMLRERLWAFLEADFEMLTEYQRVARKPKWPWTLFGAKTKLVTPNRLNELGEKLTQAHREYEMLRRLICYDNKSLTLAPTDLENTDFNSEWN